MRKLSDITLLEELINRYGKTKIVNYISKLNEIRFTPLHNRYNSEFPDFSEIFDKDDMEFLMNYTNIVYPLDEHIKDLNFAINHHIPDDDVVAFAKNKLNRLKEEYNSYIAKRKELEDKYGHDKVSEAIMYYDDYSN